MTAPRVQYQTSTRWIFVIIGSGAPAAFSPKTFTTFSRRRGLNRGRTSTESDFSHDELKFCKKDLLDQCDLQTGSPKHFAKTPTKKGPTAAGTCLWPRRRWT